MKGLADLVVLRALDRHGESYGYGLIERIGEDSQDLFAFQEGTLYPLLYRLERDGFVSSRRKAGSSGKERRYYRLTEAGRKRLAERTQEYRGFLKGMSLILDRTSA